MSDSLTYWTPVIKPPCPTTVSGISPLAELIIQKLRCQYYAEEEKRRQLRPQYMNMSLRDDVIVTYNDIELNLYDKDKIETTEVLETDQECPQHTYVVENNDSVSNVPGYGAMDQSICSQFFEGSQYSRNANRSSNHNNEKDFEVFNCKSGNRFFSTSSNNVPIRSVNYPYNTKRNLVNQSSRPKSYPSKGFTSQRVGTHEKYSYKPIDSVFMQKKLCHNQNQKVVEKKQDSPTVLESVGDFFNDSDDSQLLKALDGVDMVAAQLEENLMTPAPVTDVLSDVGKEAAIRLLVHDSNAVIPDLTQPEPVYNYNVAAAACPRDGKLKPDVKEKLDAFKNTKTDYIKCNSAVEQNFNCKPIDNMDTGVIDDSVKDNERAGTDPPSVSLPLNDNEIDNPTPLSLEVVKKNKIPQIDPSESSPSALASEKGKKSARKELNSVVLPLNENIATLNEIEMDNTFSLSLESIEKPEVPQKSLRPFAPKRNAPTLDTKKEEGSAKTRRPDHPLSENTVIPNKIEVDNPFTSSFESIKKAKAPRLGPSSRAPASKKKKSFQVPYKKLVQTKLFQEPEEAQVFEISLVSIQDLERQLSFCPPTEICLTLMYSTGETQLSKPESSGTCRSIYFRMQWAPDNIEYFRLDILSDLWKINKMVVKTFFQVLFTSKSNVVCIEASELIVFLIQKLKYSRDETTKWNIMDPLIGFWMCNPDETCGSFKELTDQLQCDRSELRKLYEPQTKLCKYLDLLSIVTKDIVENLKKENLWSLFTQMEIKLTPILARMTYHGLKIDENKLTKLGRLIGFKVGEIEKEALSIIGRPIQLSSAVQLRKVLFEELKLDKNPNIQMKETSTNVKSTSEAVLSQLVGIHPLPKLILEYRKLQKLKSTYIDGILCFVKKGILNTIWEQCSAATGRLASSNPNLQAIPKNGTTVSISKDETLNINVRSTFSARPGYSLLLADFQHIEFRIFAHLSQDESLIQLFHETGDIFTKLAEQWLQKLSNAIDKTDREKTKKTVYAIMYGAGPAKLAEVLQISNVEASKILQNFCEKFPSFRCFLKKVSEKCQKDGFMTTMRGRVRKFPNIKNSDQSIKAQVERQALNFVIQGAAADICKEAMLLTEKELLSAKPPVDAELLLQIHDELVWEVRQDQMEQVKDIVSKVMEDTDALNGHFTHLSVPIRVKIEERVSWANAEGNTPSPEF